MPSPEEGTQRKSESGSGQSSDQPPPPPPTNSGTPNVTAGPPPGNSSAMGYPGYPPPYQPYPNGPYGNQYMYTQAPPAAYYGSSAYPRNQNPGIRDPASGFFRGIFAGLATLLVLMFLSTIITWLILRPKIPSVAVTRFAVSGFNVSGPVLSAQWTANLRIKNPNTKLKAYFNLIRSFVYYSNANDDDEFLATALPQPMYVDTEKTAELAMNLTTGEKDQPMVPSWVVDDLRKERGTGTVSFNLRMFVSASFKTDNWASKVRGMKVFCEKLKVGFDRDTRNGAVLLPKPHECAVYV